MNITLRFSARTAHFSACFPVAAAVQRCRVPHQRRRPGATIDVPVGRAELVVHELENRGHTVVVTSSDSTSRADPEGEAGAHRDNLLC